MKSLLHGLLKMRIRPYYLYQCDRIVGTEHFWTPLTTGLDLIDQLQGYTTGFAVPQFIVDSPIGKIPLCRSKLVELNDDYAILSTKPYHDHTVGLTRSRPYWPSDQTTWTNVNRAGNAGSTAKYDLPSEIIRKECPMLANVKRVAILVEREYEDMELWYPYLRLMKLAAMSM